MLESDKHHRKAMEWGSRQLRDAILGARKGVHVVTRQRGSFLPPEGRVE